MKIKFYSYSPVFHIDHNEDWFFCMLLLCTTFRSIIYTVHYFLWAFSAKMVTYLFVIGNVYFMKNWKILAFFLIFPSFGPCNKSGPGKSWQIVEFMFNFKDLIFRWTLNKVDISLKRTLLSSTNVVHFIEIPLLLLKRHIEFKNASAHYWFLFTKFHKYRNLGGEGEF